MFLYKCTKCEGEFAANSPKHCPYCGSTELCIDTSTIVYKTTHDTLPLTSLQDDRCYPLLENILRMAYIKSLSEEDILYKTVILICTTYDNHISVFVDGVGAQSIVDKLNRYHNVTAYQTSGLKQSIISLLRKSDTK